MGVDFAQQSVSATRFAPSPNGLLHIGHAFSALCAHDFARDFGGKFQLRIEDIDGTRSRPEHVEAIFEDMRWLGLAWDREPVFQSRRIAHYLEALERLKAQELVLSLLVYAQRNCRSVESAIRAARARRPRLSGNLPRDREDW